MYDWRTKTARQAAMMRRTTRKRAWAEREANKERGKILCGEIKAALKHFGKERQK